MSLRQLFQFETDLLTKGLYFSITSKTLPNKDMAAIIKDALKNFEKKRLTRFVPK